MSRIESQIYIERPPQTVFEYVSTPGRWPEWHPASLRLSSEAGQPLMAGARFEEDIRVGKREAHLVWQVRDARTPKFWIADAASPEGLRLNLRYDLEPRGNGTRFTRTLDYELQGLWNQVLNLLILKRRIESESAHSLFGLKRVIEAMARSPR